MLAFAGDGLARRVRAEAEIERERDESASPEVRAAAAVRSLLSGARDQAVTSLEAAWLERRDDPRLLNDLAAAYLVRGLEENRPLDLLDALALTEEGVQRDGAGLEVYFNHAYALSSLYLREAAREAWEAYLEVDPGRSRWSEIAHQRLQDLREPLMYERWAEDRGELRRAAMAGSSREVRALARAFPEQVLEEAEAWLFEEWPEAVESGGSTAGERRLDAIRIVASALPVEAGGALLLGALSHLESMGSTTARESLARAYGALAKGNSLLERLEPGPAMPGLEAAVEELRALQSPYAPRARLLVAICHFHNTSYGEAASTARVAYEGSLRTADLSTTIRSLQLLGLIESVEYRFGAALESYHLALDAAHEVEWHGARAATEGLIGEVYAFLGDDQAAWRHRLLALRDEGSIHRARIRARVFNDLTNGAKRQGPGVGRYFARGLVAAATMSGIPVAAVVALEQRASVAALAGDPRSALADLDEAEIWVGRLADPVLAETLRGNLLRTRGEVLVAESPAEALSVLDIAVEAYRRTSYEVGLPSVLRLRAQALRAMGRRSEAEGDLQVALHKSEVAALDLSDPRERIELAREARPIYDELVDLKIRAGDLEAALSIAERSRWKVGSPRYTRAVWPDAAGGHVPPDTAVIVYRLLRDRLVIWVVKRDGLAFSEVPRSRDELSRLIGRARHSLLYGSSKESTEALNRILIEPIASSLEGVSRLAVVLDGPLHAVPVGAIRDSSSGRYLLEDFEIVVSRSVADFLLAAGESDRGAFGRTSTLLAVANPATAPELQLPRLPYAESEILEIQRHFPLTALLVGEAASEDRLLATQSRHQILHVAGHVLNNDSRPLWSSLVLSPGPRGDGLLLAQEVLGRNLGDLELVVLSACSSIGGEGGSINVANAFLEAGVPTVLASLWEVADRVGEEVFSRFYAALARGLSPAEAFHFVQKELLASPDPVLSAPKTWAGFRLLRGATASAVGVNTDEGHRPIPPPTTR